jgi:hypothetical protein
MSLLADDVLELDGEVIEETQEYHAVHPTPGWEQVGNKVGNDVAVDDVAVKGEVHLVALAGVVRGHMVEDDEDERPDVLDTCRLSVEVSDDRDLILRGVRDQRGTERGEPSR